jgi:hypothetical protein
MNELKAATDCPVSLEPLLTAYTTQCGHSFNQAACVQIFGNMVNGACEKQNVPCPTCRTVVTSYTPNFVLRDLVARIQQLVDKEDEDKALVVDVLANAERAPKRQRRDELPAQPPVVPVERAAVEPNYPGQPAHFIHTEGDWQPFASGGILCKILRFKSQNENALIKEFALLGDNNGGIRLSISFKRDHQELKNYLRHHGVLMHAVALLTGHMYTDSLNQTQKLFSILATNNQIPQEHYDIMRPIVERGHH